MLFIYILEDLGGVSWIDWICVCMGGGVSRLFPLSFPRIDDAVCTVSPCEL